MNSNQPVSILLADDEKIVRKTIGDYLIESGYHVEEASDGLIALKLIKSRDYELALVDVRMPGLDGLSLLDKIREIRPDLSVVIITAHGNMEIAIQALRLGATDFLTKPIKFFELDCVLEKSDRIRALRREKRHLRETIRGIQTLDDIRTRNRHIVGNSRAAHRVHEQVRQAVEAKCDTILITGETGTGKEVVAREIHFQASSDESPFIAVSCPALPDSLVDSELFGHVKGAFTGATTNRAGYFELADGGTLFLDEVADLSASAQAKLLRILETRSLRRVGGSKEINVNIRVIAATNVSLEQLIEEGKFRRDLFYRLNIYSIHILPLRDRQDDILPLAEYFLSAYAKTRGLYFDGFSSEAKKLLLNYNFPGNARELLNLVQRAAILSRSGQVLPEHLNLPNPSGEAISTPSVTSQVYKERTLILNALEKAKWNRRKAAQKLGIPYSTFRFKMQKLGIK